MLKNNKFLPVIIVIIVVTVSGGIFAADKWYQHRLYNELHCTSWHVPPTEEVVHHSYENADVVFRARMVGYQFDEENKIPDGIYKILEVYKRKPLETEVRDSLEQRDDYEGTNIDNPHSKYDRQIGDEYIFFSQSNKIKNSLLPRVKPCRHKMGVKYIEPIVVKIKEWSK